MQTRHELLVRETEKSGCVIILSGLDKAAFCFDYVNKCGLANINAFMRNPNVYSLVESVVIRFTKKLRRKNHRKEGALPDRKLPPPPPLFSFLGGGGGGGSIFTLTTLGSDVDVRHIYRSYLCPTGGIFCCF